VTRGEAIEPASYVNFCITNDLVVVPFFGLAQDEAAREAIASHFPGRATIGLPATALLAGGGAFHCASMQFPAG
jgi:agmatine deiminase